MLRTAVGLIALVLAAGAGTSSIAAQYRAMIVTWRGCEEACTGLRDYLASRPIDVEIVLRDADGDRERLPRFLAEARAEGVDLIVTWGTTVSVGIAGTLKDRDDPAFNNEIPQVFMIVADPVAAGLVESLERTGRRNVTGTHNRVPEAVNIDTIRSYLPGFRRLGLIYNPDEPNAVLKRNELAELALLLRFELIALDLPIYGDGKPRAADIPATMARLRQAGVDFVYLGSSSFLRSHGDVLTRAALDNGLPLLSPYEELVHASEALISVAARYYDVGRLAGVQAEKILVRGVIPGELPVAPMTEFAVVINMRVAKALRIFPPMRLLQIAETVE